MSPKKLAAIAFLGFHLILHFIKKILGRSQRHKHEFIASYRDDHIFPLPPERRRQMYDHSHCYVCRLCDTVCPQIISTPGALAPSYIVAGFARSLTDYHYFNADDGCMDCKMCEDACPQNVPIKEIIVFMNEMRNQSPAKTAAAS